MTPERLDTALRQAVSGDPPNILQDLVKQIRELVPSAGESGVNWLKGKGAQELAKAEEIRARVLALVGPMELERLRLIQERDAANAAGNRARSDERNRHKERMHELETQRLAAVADSQKKKAEALQMAVLAIKALGEMGVSVEVGLVAALLPV